MTKNKNVEELIAGILPEKMHVMENLIDESNVLSNRELARKTRNETIELCQTALLKAFKDGKIGVVRNDKKIFEHLFPL